MNTLKTSKYILLIAFALLTGVIRNEASVFPQRQRTRTNRECSLKAVSEGALENNCQIESVNGKTTEGGFLLNFGETNCTVTLHNCVPGICYSILDRTDRLLEDEVLRSSSGSFFTSVEISGARSVRCNRHGISFVPSGSKIHIEYSTITCSDFFWSHGQIEHQLCDNPFDAVSMIETGMPYSLKCD